MMVVLGLYVLVAALAVGFLVCLKHDLPHLYLKAKRIILGLMTAGAVAATSVYLFLSMYGCADVDMYSFSWYLMWCMGHSS